MPVDKDINKLIKKLSLHVADFYLSFLSVCVLGVSPWVETGQPEFTCSFSRKITEQVIC